jgi:hypothetical protein
LLLSLGEALFPAGETERVSAHVATCTFEASFAMSFCPRHRHRP